jgi:hypothetical protein
MKNRQQLIADHDLLVRLHNRTCNEKKASKLRQCIASLKGKIRQPS